jgi:hypothetical protein
MPAAVHIVYIHIVYKVHVMDKGTKMCVDPGGNEAILSVGRGGGPGPPGREENGQLASYSGGD